jgi:hypothetical protein
LATVIVACESGERGLFESGERGLFESGERGLFESGGSVVAEKLYTIAVEVVTVACESDGSCVPGESGVSCTPVFGILFTL